MDLDWFRIMTFHSSLEHWLPLIKTQVWFSAPCTSYPSVSWSAWCSDGVSLLLFCQGKYAAQFWESHNTSVTHAWDQKTSLGKTGSPITAMQRSLLEMRIKWRKGFWGTFLQPGSLPTPPHLNSKLLKEDYCPLTLYAQPLALRSQKQPPLNYFYLSVPCNNSVPLLLQGKKKKVQPVKFMENTACKCYRK